MELVGEIEFFCGYCNAIPDLCACDLLEYDTWGILLYFSMLTLLYRLISKVCIKNRNQNNSTIISVVIDFYGKAHNDVRSPSKV